MENPRRRIDPLAAAHDAVFDEPLVSFPAIDFIESSNWRGAETQSVISTPLPRLPASTATVVASASIWGPRGRNWPAQDSSHEPAKTEGPRR
jgi:hypothetical protein